MDTQKLLTIARITDGIPPEQFQMETTWMDYARSCVDTCGSVGCMLGHSAAAIGQCKTDRDLFWEAHHFLGMSENQIEFVFGMYHYNRRRGDRTKELPHQAAARVRKFVYYHLRRAELDEAWNERQHKRGMACVGHPVMHAIEQVTA